MIVHDNDLVFIPGPVLVFKRFEARPDRVLLVPDRQDDGDKPARFAGGRCVIRLDREEKRSEGHGEIKHIHNKDDGEQVDTLNAFL